MIIENTSIEGVKKIFPNKFHDNRGEFIKDYSNFEFAKNGIDFSIKETFYSFSFKGVIRGMHYQTTKEQAKLVRCMFGEIFDVIVDLRKDSHTFKKWESFHLSNQDDSFELFIPEGCAHGFLALNDSLVAYKCSENFYQEYDSGVIWNDKVLGIQWPLNAINKDPIVSQKDQNLLSLDEFLKNGVL